jgi:group I intron endonuclease
MTARIYLVTNNVNGKQYVGQTITQHSRHGHGHAMRDAYKKYGFKNFTYDIVVSGIDKDNLFLDYAEKFWIEVMNTLAPNGYNLESGGKRGKIVHHTPNKGKKASEETRKKMSESQRKHWSSYDVHPRKGSQHTEEWKQAASERMKKQVQSEETKLKRSESIKQWHKKRKEMQCL